MTRAQKCHEAFVIAALAYALLHDGSDGEDRKHGDPADIRRS